MARNAIALGFVLLQCFLLVSVEAQYGNCRTPNGIAGTCIPIRECLPLLVILTSRPLAQTSVDFLRRSRCEFSNKEPSVCCPYENSANNSSSDSRGNKLDNTPIDLRNNPLLPKDCGRDLSLRIVGGEFTELDEFPWIALLEYRHQNGIITSCGGVLISRRYVLTAAHCLKRKSSPNWTLENVRLGEYDTSTDRDCVEDGDNSQICADVPLSVGIEEQFIHEQYEPTSNDRLFDVALLRLTRDVKFTNYIQPICLPSNYTFPTKLHVAGWGSTDVLEDASNVKKKLSLSVADQDDCTQKFKTISVHLGQGQVCAGGRKGQDTCRGDSGGPLMSVERTPDGTNRWTTVGIISFGHPVCGTEGWPGVYTKVIDYVPWALGKMKP